MQKRDPLIQTLLSFFVPIYILYWFYVTGKEVQTTYSQKMPSIWLLIAPTLFAIISIPLYFILFIAAMSSSPEAGIATGISSFIVVPAIFLLAWAVTLYYDYRFSEGIENVIGQEASKVLVFVLLFFIPAAAVFVVQEKLNKHAQFGTFTPPNPGQPQQFPQSPIQPQQPVSPTQPAQPVQPQQFQQPPVQPTAAPQTFAPQQPVTQQPTQQDTNNQ